MGIFAAREAAEDFIQGDPFFLNDWSIRAWNESLF
jgi:hypothetical protein